MQLDRFLIRRNKSIIAEQEVIKDFVLKHSQGAIAKTDQIVFVHSGKLVNQNVSVGEFLEKWYRDEEEDGWLHYKAVTQDVFGWFLYCLPTLWTIKFLLNTNKYFYDLINQVTFQTGLAVSD